MLVQLNQKTSVVLTDIPKPTTSAKPSTTTVSYVSKPTQPPPQQKPQEKEKKPGRTKSKGQKEKSKERRPPTTGLEAVNEVPTETERPLKEKGEKSASLSRRCD